MKVVPCEIYSRVVGYFRPVWNVIAGVVVPNWNEGKVAEFKDRKPYDVNVSLAHQHHIGDATEMVEPPGSAEDRAA